MKKVDLHIHTTVSDSSMTPEEVVQEALRANLFAIAVTDHDSVGGIESAMEAARQTDIEIIPGVEISTECFGREIHVLGYFIDYTDSDLRYRLKELELGRISRARRMVERLNEHEIPLSFERVKEIAGDGVVARPHIARAMVEGGWVSDYSEAFGRYIADDAPCYVEKKMLSHVQSIELVREMGGVPVLAHPKDERTMANLPRLIEAGLLGIEVWHPDHGARFTEYLLQYAQKNGLVATGGSDSHGTRKVKSEIGRLPVPYSAVEELRRICRIGRSAPAPPEEGRNPLDKE
jgi:predicted metal-dependent phosphoesterase TrpH